ncbi:MAG: GNAT family N-acetyltransferase [Lachnospiraceae bacterium]|nr:GNAT family N-acetyltransferase [Lachnospiraceae bacterium]
MNDMIKILKATPLDINEIGIMFDDICDYLSSNNNYPKWQKGVYPTIEDARVGISENALYVAKLDDRIVGTMILRHKPEEGYNQAKWPTKSNYERIYVIYTLAVHQDYWGQEIGETLLKYAIHLAKEDGCIAVRLDVVKGNYPAINLYKKCGFKYIDTVSLGYEKYGIPWYELYEITLIH